MHRKKNKKILYYIQYYVLKLLLFIMFCFPYEIRSKIGGIIFNLYGNYSKFKQIAMNNLSLIFPEKTQAEKNKILLSVWQNFGRSFAEFPYIYSISAKKYQQKTIFHGVEHLENIRNGGILFSAHYGNWEIVPRFLLEQNLKISIIYRKANNALLEKLIQNYRNQKQVNFIAKGKSGARALFRAIKERHVIIMLIDQRMNEGVKMPFLGHETYVPDGIANLALEYNLPIIPVKTFRNAENKIDITFFPVLNLNFSGKNLKNVYNLLKIVNLYIEDWIKQDPGQWMWFHNRWKK